MPEPETPTIFRRISLLIWRFRWLLLALVLIGAVLVWGATIYANLSTRSVRYNLDKTAIQKIPHEPLAIVFGAGIYPDGTPTPYLQWRVDTAVQLYKAHRVDKILMTGDNSTKNHNEPVAMRTLAEKQGVPSKDIVLDYAGFNTYDSCYRAHAIFKVTNATLVTQGYHLPRAVMACKDLGIKVIGVDAEHDKGRSWGVNYIVREWISTDKIVLQLIFKPHPTALGPVEPITYK